MTEQRGPEEPTDSDFETERRLAEYFGEEVAASPAPGSVWSNIADEVDASDEPHARRWRIPEWLSMRPYAAFAGTFALLIAVSGAWVVSGMWDGGSNSLAIVPAGADGAWGAAGLPGPNEKSLEQSVTLTGALAIPTVRPGQPTPTPRPAAAPTPTPGPGLWARTAGVEGTAYGADEDGNFLQLALPSITDTPTPRPNASGASSVLFQAAGRNIVSNASVVIEVENVRPAMAQLRAIAEGLGGFVEQLSTSGGPEPRQGNATVRVPGADVFTALERIEALGEVLGEAAGSEDVSSDLIDLEARLCSEQTKEASFLELLDRTASVSEVLNVERELSRVRTEIERIEGQLSFLERRVSLATIVVSLQIPAEAAIDPPAASMHVEVDDAGLASDDVKAMVSAVGGELATSTVSLRNEGLQAFLAFRVPIAEFDQAVASLERLGTVTAKEVRDNGERIGGADDADDPQARLDVTLFEPVDEGRSRWITYGIPGGAVGAALLIALLLFAAFRLGKRRAV